MSIVNMIAVGTASADAAAMIDVPTDATLDGVFFGTYSDGNHQWELSFSSTKQDTSNDGRATIATFQGNNGVDHGFIPIGIKVMAGERLYLHRREYGAGTAGTVRISLQLHLDDKQTIARVRR